MSEYGWIGVDLDGTLVTYEGWVKWNVFGDPIPLMVERVRGWLAEGKPVKIFTARLNQYTDRRHEKCQCRTSGEKFNDADMIKAIQDYTSTFLDGHRLSVTNVKGWDMIEYWDDRAIGVERNTGRTLTDAAIAEAQAQKGAP